MRATFAWSASETSVLCASLRLVLVSFDVRMWRIFDWPRMILPVPVFLKRLAAPLCVFSLGMGFLLETESLQHLQVYGNRVSLSAQRLRTKRTGCDREKHSPRAAAPCYPLLAHVRHHHSS